MVSGKTEIKNAQLRKKADLKARKKRKFKKRYLLLAHLVVVAVIFALLLYTPARYNPLKVPAAEKKKVSKYLTHELSPRLYNGAQLGEPFDLPVTQEGINEVVAYSEWPKESGDARFSAPAVLFVPDHIALMGTVVLKGVEFVVTIVVAPSLDEQGLLNLQVTKVKVGAMNLTLLAKVMAKRMYQQRIATVPVDKEDWGAKIAASLLNDEAFEPVFEIKGIGDKEDIKVRVKKIKIEKEKLTLRLLPVPD
jgi:uncharacterized protein YpmS